MSELKKSCENAGTRLCLPVLCLCAGGCLLSSRCFFLVVVMAVLGFSAWEKETVGCPLELQAFSWSRQGWGRGCLGTGVQMAKKVKPWGRESWLTALPRGWMPGDYPTCLALALRGAGQLTQKRGRKSRWCCPSPCGRTHVTVISSVWQGPELPCRGKNRELCPTRENREEKPLHSPSRLEPACFYWEQLG